MDSVAHVPVHSGDNSSACPSDSPVGKCAAAGVTCKCKGYGSPVCLDVDGTVADAE